MAASCTVGMLQLWLQGAAMCRSNYWTLKDSDDKSCTMKYGTAYHEKSSKAAQTAAERAFARHPSRHQHLHVEAVAQQPGSLRVGRVEGAHKHGAGRQQQHVHERSLCALHRGPRPGDRLLGVAHHYACTHPRPCSLSAVGVIHGAAAACSSGREREGMEGLSQCWLNAKRLAGCC